MKKFTIIQANNLVISIILDVLKDLLISSKVEKIDDNISIIYHDFDNDEEIKSTILGLSDELMTNIICYNSTINFSNRINNEREIGLKLLPNLVPGVYNLKNAILANSNISFKNELLEFILLNSGVSTSFITDFAKYDLNVSKASKAMYVHRNTMLYKLDKLNELSGFDLRVFIDAYILYSLIEK